MLGCRMFMAQQISELPQVTIFPLNKAVTTGWRAIYFQAKRLNTFALLFSKKQPFTGTDPSLGRGLRRSAAVGQAGGHGPTTFPHCTSRSASSQG